MLGRIEKTPQAESDVDQIVETVALSSPESARRFVAAVESAYQQLAFMPELAGRYDLDYLNRRLRAWQVPGFENYIIFYVPLRDGTGIDVVRVLHGARNIGQLLS